ncbi:MAG: iron(III) transport system substrate-binding protein [Chloroflexi bacterium]|jgi:iron(III) transport system substrate-binding protein|nr:MAG: iron(III) transport system substrate-binding protein [Chloroflexota bacterium]|tara:strand:+ start:1117 stop:2193 length:1077 start_codon:yes stop_codon:yes gene_type:complete
MNIASKNIFATKKINVFAIGILISLGALFSACNSESESETSKSAIDTVDTSKTLVVYSGRKEKLIAPILIQFTAATGIKIKVKYGSSTDMALLIAEEGMKTPADVFISQSPGPVGYLADKNFLAKLPVAITSQTVTSNSGNWIGISARQRVLVYNTNTVDPKNIPASITELSKPEWASRIAISAKNSSFQDWLTLLRLEIGDDSAEKWLTDFVTNGGKWDYGNNTSIVQAVAAGEQEMGLVNHYYLLKLKAEDPTLKAANYNFADGDIGGAVLLATASILSASDNKANAKALLEYLVSNDGQKYFSTATYEYLLSDNARAIDGKLDTFLNKVKFVNFDKLGSELAETLNLIKRAGITL